MTIEVILLGLTVASAALLIVIGISRPPLDPVAARLNQMTQGQVGNLEELELQEPVFERTIRPLIAKLAATTTRFTTETFAKRTAKRLAMAGYPGDLSVTDWVAVKILLAIFGAAFGIVLLLVLRATVVQAIAIGAALSGIGYLGPEFWLRTRIRKRQRLILRALPDALDLLSISVRAGLGFDAALAKVSERTRGPLADEFRRALAELMIGRARRDSLRDIVGRTEVPRLTAFIGAVIQAEHLGVSVSKVLQVQSEQARIYRRQQAEEMAAKAPIKMLFPLVGCIFPALFIVILGPTMIVLWRVFGERS